MFAFMLELMTQTVFVFCFCNLIIVIILVGSKSSSNLDQEGEIPLSVIINTSTNHKQGTKSEQFLDDNELSINGNELSNSQEAPVAEKEENGNSNDNKDVDKDDDDELRRRVEEFIEMVNKDWKAELLGSSCLV